MRMRISTINAVALALALSLAAGGAKAADASFYAGASVGKSSLSVDNTPIDTDATAFKLFGGYEFSKYLAAEITYFDAGSLSETIGVARYDMDINGFSAAAVGRIPVVDALTIFGKLGLVTYDRKTDRRIGSTTTTLEDESETDLTYGIGVSYEIVRHVELRAEYEVADIADGKFNLVSLGGAYRFR